LSNRISPADMPHVPMPSVMSRIKSLCGWNKGDLPKLVSLHLICMYKLCFKYRLVYHGLPR
jgi:hypothetical protein